MHRLPCRAPQAPASPAFPSCSLTGFSHDSAWPHVIYFDLGTKSRVLESDHPNSGKCRASPSREGRVPSSRRAGSIGNRPLLWRPRREAAPIASAAAPYVRCISRTLLPASPAAHPAGVAGKQAPPVGKSCPTLQERAAGARQARVSLQGPPQHTWAVPRHPQMPQRCPPSGACGCISFPKRLHQHLHLQLGGQPAQEPRGIGLRPTKLIARGPLHSAQPPLSPHPLRRTGQSPEPSATALLPSQGGKEGSDGFAGLSHARMIPARSCPCLPTRSSPTTSAVGTLAPGQPASLGAAGLSPWPLLPKAAGRHGASWVQGSSLLTPAESQGISRLREKTGTGCVRQWPGSPQHSQLRESEACRIRALKLPSLTLFPWDRVPPQGPGCLGRAFSAEGRPFPRAIPPLQGPTHQHVAQPRPQHIMFLLLTSHQCRHRAAPVPPVPPPPTSITSASPPPWGFPRQPATALPSREVQGRQGHHGGDTPRRGVPGKAEPSACQEHPCPLPSSGGCG